MNAPERHAETLNGGCDIKIKNKTVLTNMLGNFFGLPKTFLSRPLAAPCQPAPSLSITRLQPRKLHFVVAKTWSVARASVKIAYHRYLRSL